MSTTPRTEPMQQDPDHHVGPQPIAGEPGDAKGQRPVGTEVRDSSDHRETLVTGEKPLGHKAPGAPFMLVGLAYMTVLVVIALILAAIFWN